MRVLHVLPPAAGGMLRHVQCLVAGIDDVESCCAAVPGAGLEMLSPLLPGRSAPLPFPDRATLPAVLRASLAAAAASRKLRPDLLHGHGYRGMLVAGIASRLTGRPFLFTAHTLPSELGPRFWRLARPLARRAAGVACVSQAIRAELAEQVGAASFRNPQSAIPHFLRVIYNGIDPGPPPGPRSPLPADLGCGGRRPVALTAARLAPQKGVADLVEAWGRLAPDLPSGILIIAGDGPLRGELEARAASLAITDSVRLPGFRDDVDALLQAADLAVIPSLAEGQSIFALEAMARGVPVVATRVGGLPETVRDGRTGLLAPPGEPAALAAAMARLLRETDLASTLAAAGRALVEAEMTVGHMLAGYSDLYAEVWHAVKER